MDYQGRKPLSLRWPFKPMPIVLFRRGRALLILSRRTVTPDELGERWDNWRRDFFVFRPVREVC
jgi:hypothetical protein